MTRRDFFSTTAAFAAPRVLAQDGYPGIAYRRYSRCLPDYLYALAMRAYQARNREIGKLTTVETIRLRQRWVAETFWKLTGGRPERTPLNARVVGSFDRPGYRLEKIVYESRPGFHIAANFYLPTEGKPPYPGVLFQMGHTLNGKAGDSYQKGCQGLARLGFAVLAFDPMGQGERTYYPRAGGVLTRLSSADEEHTKPGFQMILAGDTSTRLQTWDAVRSLDYLAEHPMVDPKRLASTGQSGGATLTMLLAAVDDRLAAAVVSSGNTENLACAGFLPPGSTDDAEQNFLDGGPAGFDRWDTLYPLAPKPLLVLVSARDYFGTYSPNYLSSGWEEYKKLKKVYEVLGHGDRLEWGDTPMPHNFGYALRLKTYNWFRRWLQDKPEPVREEPPVNVEKDETLWAGPTGNVVRDFDSETPFSLNRKQAERIQTPARPAGIDELLRVEKPAAAPRASVVGRVSAGPVDVEAIEVPSTSRVFAPAWLFLPRKAETGKPVLIIAEPQGRNSRWREGDLYPSLAEAGLVVCAADVRGTGDLVPEVSPGAAGYQRWHQEEENYAWSSLMLGRPLLGQRVTDLLAFAAALRAHNAARGRRIVLAARGTMTVPALFAAALDPGIAGVYLAGGLVSWRSVVETEDFEYPLANLAYGALGRTDLPQLAASLAPRKVWLAGTVDAAGKRMNPEAVRSAYASAPNVEVLPDPSWDIAALARL